MPAIRTHPRSTALEVTTDAPLPPTLSIISPTPRAFTFSANTAPFVSSPSASPFEHDLTLKPLRLQTPDAIVRTLTPESAASMSSPTFSSPTSSLRHSPVSPERAPRPRSRSREGRVEELTLGAASGSFAIKRRKSTGGVAEPSERRPKRGDEDYIKRPENAFILFRRKCVEERLAAQAAADEEAAAQAAAAAAPASKPKKHRQADLSKMISQQWRSLGAEERSYWEQLAKEKKKEHEKLHPDYVYRPQRTKRAKSNAVPPSKKGKGRADEGLEDVDESVEFELPLTASAGRHGRSASAPNGPHGTQTIRLPVVHMPSVPSSPLLLPSVPLNAIGRRPSIDWARPAPHRPLEAQAVQSLFQPQYMMQHDASMDYQQQAQFFHQGMYEISAAAPAEAQPTLAPLLVPQSFFPGNPSPFSPADSVSPLSAYGSPFTPIAGVADQWARLSISSDASDLSEASTHTGMDGQYGALPDLYEQPWAFEFVGEYVPGGAEFLMDDFDLSKIPQVALSEVCPEPGMGGGVHPSEQGSAAAQAPHLHSAHGQDLYAGLFYDNALARY